MPMPSLKAWLMRGLPMIDSPEVIQAKTLLVMASSLEKLVVAMDRIGQSLEAIEDILKIERGK